MSYQEGILSVYHMGFPGDFVVKNPPAMQETQVRSLGEEDPLKKGMAIHSSILDWKIPRTEKPGGATVHGVTKESETTEQLNNNSGKAMQSRQSLFPAWRHAENDS